MLLRRSARLGPCRQELNNCLSHQLLKVNGGEREYYVPLQRQGDSLLSRRQKRKVMSMDRTEMTFR